MGLSFWLFALLPFAAVAVAGIVPAFARPNAHVRSMLNHFAAGVVFSVAAVEFLPEVRQDLTPLLLALSFLAGVGFMLGLERLTQHIERLGGKGSAVTTGFLVAVGVDLLLDGLLLGIGFAVGKEQGVLLAIALALEGIAIGFAISAYLLDAGRSRMYAAALTACLGLLVFGGAIVGDMLLHGLSKSGLGLILSFGLAALLYLVTEELLVEAHEEGETPLASAMFFIGFLIFVVLGMIV